ncbi:MAG: cellulose binding domain-containing protein, partial [Clostridiales bacterium]
PPYTISPTLPTSVQVDIDYIIQSNWKTGATIKIIITNTGTSSINAWELSFDFPDNQKITNLWGGSYNQIGSKVTIRNASWNSKILVNESVNIGFNLTHNGINEKPKNITID